MGQAMVLVTERGLQGDRYASAAGVASNIDPSDLRSYYDAAGKDLIIYPGLQYPLAVVRVVLRTTNSARRTKCN